MRSEVDLRGTQLDIIGGMLREQQQLIEAGMGAGKTVSILTAFSTLESEGCLNKGIILAPPRVVDLVWPRECAKWSHLQHLKVAAVRGTPKQREKLLMRDDVDLFAVSINSIKWLADVLAEISDNDPLKDFLAIDEISKLRDPRSKLAKYGFEKGLWQSFDNIYGATGTVMPNSYEDLWQQYRIVSQGKIWGGQSFDEWRREQFMPLDTKGYNWRVHGFAKKIIDRKVAHYTTAVEADLDLDDLNQGEDWDIEVELYDEARAAYDDMAKHLIVELLDGRELDDLSPEDLEQLTVAALSAAVGSGKEAQIAQGFIMDKVVDEELEKITSEVLHRFPNAKLDALVETAEPLLDAKDPPIVCYHYKEDLRALQETKLLKGFGYLGSGQSPRQAAKTVDDWNAGKLPGLLAHPASVGHGVELQFGGRHMIWYTPTWSSELADQMIKRIHRPGQTRPVFNRRIIARGTLDLVKRARVENKIIDQMEFKKMLQEWVK